jgi:hypothetical protein
VGAAPLDQHLRRRPVISGNGLPRREHERELSSPEIDILRERDAFVSCCRGAVVTGEGQREGPHGQDHRPDIGSKLPNQLL